MMECMIKRVDTDTKVVKSFEKDITMIFVPCTGRPLAVRAHRLRKKMIFNCALAGFVRGRHVAAARSRQRKGRLAHRCLPDRPAGRNEGRRPRGAVARWQAGRHTGEGKRRTLPASRLSRSISGVLSHVRLEPPSNSKLSMLCRRRTNRVCGVLPAAQLISPEAPCAPRRRQNRYSARHV